MKEITTDNFSFENLRSGNAIYVDKTQYVWNLVSSETRIYFLSRPRRFGKSLLLSTLEAFFLNKRKLFKGLAIDTLAPDDVWQEWPVIHLDMAQATLATCYKDLEKMFHGYIADVARSYGMTVEKEELAPAILRRTISHLKNVTGKQVVVLIDEYDKPILDALHKPYITDVVELMQGFYQTLKSSVDDERFVFITGVTKFAHTSLFSGNNNPTDLTQDRDFSAMLGYTEQELRDNFAEYIDNMAQTMKKDREKLIEYIKLFYGGYHFAPNAESIINPVTICEAIRHTYLGDFYYPQCTPSLFVKSLRKHHFNLDSYLNKWYYINDVDLSVEKPSPLYMALAAGYLTIAEESEGKVRYDYPNEEVRMGWIFLYDSTINSDDFSWSDYSKKMRARRMEIFMPTSTV